MAAVVIAGKHMRGIDHPYEFLAAVCIGDNAVGIAFRRAVTGAGFDIHGAVPAVVKPQKFKAIRARCLFYGIVVSLVADIVLLHPRLI